MPRLLQIDSCLNMLSTGRITEGIGKQAIEHGWDCYIIHGARYVQPGSCMHSIQATRMLGEYIHYIEGLFFDNHGLASRCSTKTIVERIKKLRPDVIQLHCIHGYYINYKLLFEYLNETNIPVVWTFHDCWAFTGHCAHFVTANCFKWREEGCHKCPQKGCYPKSFVDYSQRNYSLKKELFIHCKNLHIVTVSDWLASFVRDSFLGDKEIRVINNGVDINQFYPCSAKASNRFRIIGVASAWGEGKGLHDFFKLREVLPDNEYDITLVGLSDRQIKMLPAGISGISKTNAIKELARLYSQSDVLVNPTYADSFPTVNMEALACGIPVITYNTGGSPEVIDEKTGVVVEQGNIESLVSAIKRMKTTPFSSSECRNRAVFLYDKDKRFADYIQLYEDLKK